MPSTVNVMLNKVETQAWRLHFSGERWRTSLSDKTHRSASGSLLTPTLWRELGLLDCQKDITVSHAANRLPSVCVCVQGWVWGREQVFSRAAGAHSLGRGRSWTRDSGLQGGPKPGATQGEGRKLSAVVSRGLPGGRGAGPRHGGGGVAARDCKTGAFVGALLAPSPLSASPEQPRQDWKPQTTARD